ncbi:MAG: hypothetical protein JXR68_01125 [Bacteroidales bacterium]|nr:hypothetical protein [Bacteroidales bacterium]
MKKISFFIALFILLNLSVNAFPCKKTLLVVSYNVENLMDTLDTPLKSDQEFLPTSDKQWSTQRYFKKLNDIAAVINDIDKKHFPDLIGLVEIENKAVVEDLLKTHVFLTKGYKISHRETKDPRGIDLALVYNPKIFDFYADYQYDIFDSNGVAYNTRQIYLVKGIVEHDTLYVFLNHWKSRSGGQTETQFKRILAAKRLNEIIQYIFSYNPSANIICLGDFNDTPTDISINQTLNASSDSIFASDYELFNLTAHLAKQNLGTYNYRGNWNMIDNIIVTQNFLNKKNTIYAKNTAQIYSSSLNSYYSDKLKLNVPNKTYGGDNYYGGVSDHYPIYCYLKVK